MSSQTTDTSNTTTRKQCSGRFVLEQLIYLTPPRVEEQIHHQGDTRSPAPRTRQKSKAFKNADHNDQISKERKMVNQEILSENFRCPHPGNSKNYTHKTPEGEISPFPHQKPRQTSPKPVPTRPSSTKTLKNITVTPATLPHTRCAPLTKDR
ncbi:hypothetical protein [Paeniglutamicibacter sp. Y32M11]|uniref:hypothetical protein n=1 Tax=Paeniglutamicibacter sp. Y32M11 TaxID=2853258 RepID=UPI001C533804|nr:hypothetical protein [Paeniglutamicibacter sp. Y32M11]QXQ10785.1 hypothetical protein KUF55_02260 [Paeniglutamicibacter sp. Y32M11]